MGSTPFATSSAVQTRRLTLHSFVCEGQSKSPIVSSKDLICSNCPPRNRHLNTRVCVVSLQDSAPKWNPELASTSEAAVKADQDTEDTPKTLQEKTVSHLKHKD